ncbi:kinase domain-containing protein [Microthyrium microscopicum]|uniref:Kinase domain-containing protein n=1 Tax=Microthyrium microscopicum TaxID=703497 RepID=A0A6A6UE08_9PEZI|nr:kinase domain-containing protein [Microthyrium microscopicum]
MSLQDANDYGDFIDSDDDERAPEFCEIEESAEPIQQYKKGTFYPVYIGEVLHGNYHVIHKLGRGGFSSVWMAHDIANHRDVALKIIVSGNSGDHEYNIHQQIIRDVKDTSSLLLCLNVFHLEGYQCRRHTVLVLPVQGPSFQMCLYKRPIAARMSAAWQLLRTLKKLHDAKIVHGATATPLDDRKLNVKHQYLGRPQKIMLPNTIWKRADLVLPIAETISENLLQDTIYLADFGLSFKTDQPVPDIKGFPPGLYRAPELWHGIKCDYARDIWSYMFIFTHLYLGVRPWLGNGSSTVLANMVKILGPLPQQRMGHYEHPPSGDVSWYCQSRVPDLRLEALDAKIQRLRPEVSEIERSHFLSVIAKGFCYLPENRITAGELLDDESFRALMEHYQL